MAKISSEGFRIETDTGPAEFYVGNVTDDFTLTSKSGVQVSNISATYGRINVAKSSASGTGATYLLRSYYEGLATGGLTSTNTNVALVTSSDYRLKDNVSGLTNALTTIGQLNPCTFTWKTDNSPDYGFIAHELQSVLPDAVIGEKDEVDQDGNPEYQAVDYSKLIPVLTAALKEQNDLISALEARVLTLENGG